MSTATTRRVSDSRVAITFQFRADPKSPCAINKGGPSDADPYEFQCNMSPDTAARAPPPDSEWPRVNSRLSAGAYPARNTHPRKRQAR